MDFTTASASDTHPSPDTASLRGWRRVLVRGQMVASILRLGLRAYGDPLRAYRAMRAVRELGRRYLPLPPRLVRHRGRVFGRQAGAGYPSRAFDRGIEVELNRALPFRAGVDLPMALVAITRHCALHCQHCSEWDTLNQPEVLSVDQLREVVAALQAHGVAHIELTGGEPLLRLDALEAIVRGASADSDFWVLTSGAQMTERCARRMADAGVTGVMVSLDHWDPARHDAFRGVAGTWERAVRALTLARDAGLLTGISVTVTRETATLTDLLALTEIARARGASYVRVLEPQASGRWADADVQLGPTHRAALAALADAANARWPDDAPIIEDVDALRRAAGCQGAGERFLFVDAAGDVHACPFCHGVAGTCLGGGLDAALARLRERGCRVDDAEALVQLRPRRSAEVIAARR